MKSRIASIVLVLLLAFSSNGGAQTSTISAFPDSAQADLTDVFVVDKCVGPGCTQNITVEQVLDVLTGGAGISYSARTISTMSSETDFLVSGALTCGAATQGKVQVHTTPLQYCDNTATPTLRYACYGDSSGAALTGDSATAFFSTGEIEDVRIPSTIARDSELPTEASLEAILDLQDLQGAVTDTQVPNAITIDLAASATSALGLVCTTCVDASDIASDAVTEPKLKAVDTASDEECLTYETTTGDFEWQVCSADTDDQTASEVPYTPIDGADWVNPDPDDVADGLDKLADRLTTEEAKADDDVPESGDFTNLALTGPITSSGVATTITDDAITEAKLKAVDVPADEDCLTYESTGGDFEYQPCGGTVNSFETIATDLGTPPVADSSSDTLTIIGGGPITTTGTEATDTISLGLDSSQSGFLIDGDTTDLTCGSAAEGKAQVMDNGRFQYCDGNSASVLRSGFLDADGVDGGVSDHGALTGLGDDDHTQYALLAGRLGGQTLIGGTGVSDTLILDGSTGTAGNFQVFAGGGITSSGQGTFSDVVSTLLGGFLSVIGGNEKIHVETDLKLSSDSVVKWYNNIDIGSGTPHVGLAPGATGELKVTNGSTGSGDLLLDEEQELRFAEANANGSNIIAFKAPVSIAVDRSCILVDGAAPIPDSCVGDGTDAGGGSGDVVGPASATDNAIARYDSTTGKLIQDSSIKVEDYVSTSPASDYVSITPFGADSIISTRINYVGANGSPGVYGAGILINGTSVGIQSDGTRLKTWDGGGGNASLIIGTNLFFNGLTSSFPALRLNGTIIEAVLADSSAFAPFSASNVTTNAGLITVSQTLSIVDNGTPALAASGTLTLTKSFAKCDCADVDGCNVTMSETGMVDGWKWTVVNISSNVCNFADTSGVSELPVGGIALGQWDSLSGIYVTDRHVAVSTSNN
jgi:hypothetical protein